MLGDGLNALMILLSETSTTEMLRDGIIFVHLAAMATGAGLAIICDLLLLRRVSDVIEHHQIEHLRWVHRVIGRALTVLWLTGVGLVLVEAGLEIDNITPKIAVKTGSVALLTFTACIVARLGFPLLATSIGHSLLTLPVERKLVFAFCGGLSVSGWSSATVLGASNIAKSANAEALMALVATIHGAVVLSVMAGALLLHAIHLLREAALSRVSQQLHM